MPSIMRLAQQGDRYEIVDEDQLPPPNESPSNDGCQMMKLLGEEGEPEHEMIITAKFAQR